MGRFLVGIVARSVVGPPADASDVLVDPNGLVGCPVETLLLLDSRGNDWE